MPLSPQMVGLRFAAAARCRPAGRAWAPTRTPATALGPVLGEGSCLSESCSPRCVELLFEALAAALPPVSPSPRPANQGGFCCFRGKDTPPVSRPDPQHPGIPQWTSVPLGGRMEHT